MFTKSWHVCSWLSQIFSLFSCDETPPHNHTPQSASYERNTTRLALNMPPPPVTTLGYKTPPSDLMLELSSSDCEANGEVSGEQRKYYFRSSRVRSPDITHMTPAPRVARGGMEVDGWWWGEHKAVCVGLPSSYSCYQGLLSVCYSESPRSSRPAFASLSLSTITQCKSFHLS